MRSVKLIGPVLVETSMLSWVSALGVFAVELFQSALIAKPVLVLFQLCKIVYSRVACGHV